MYAIGVGKNRPRKNKGLLWVRMSHFPNVFLYLGYRTIFYFDVKYMLCKVTNDITAARPISHLKNDFGAKIGKLELYMVGMTGCIWRNGVFDHCGTSVINEEARISLANEVEE